MKKTVFIFICFYFICQVNSQSKFSIQGANINREQIGFELINNLIVIPLEINGSKLFFILDTGVNKTILFNLTKNDSLGLLNTKRVALQGLGKGTAVPAILSKKNTFRINNIVSENQNIYVILDDFFSLSSKMGITIHGIIGYNLIKDFILKINYKTKKIDFYNPNTFTYPKCRKCQEMPLEFYRNKPFINAEVQLDTIGNRTTKVKMLIDSGGSDALWLFENSKEDIKTPKRFFNDILGEGLSGTIYGNKSRVPKFYLGKFAIESPTVSFLDSASTHTARKFKERNGSVGGAVLKRFKVWIDYSNKKITFQKNGSLTKGFNYNMSGLDVIYDGKQLVKEEVVKKYKTPYNQDTDANNSVSFITEYSFNFKPSYIINKVIKNSAADIAGLLPRDVILKINGKPAHTFKLSDITQLLQERDKKKIKMLIERNGLQRKFTFKLIKKV